MTGRAVIVRGDARHLPLADASVDLIVTSPPYFALRSYQDGGEHLDGQVGSEPSPADFLESLWACTAEWQRVLKPTGNLFVNLGDKYAGSGGHNNAGISKKSTLRGNGHVGGINKRGEPQKLKATLRSAPDSYNKATIGGAQPKSLMGLPWRYAIGCIDGAAGDPWILCAEMVWSKPNGLPESTTDRVRRSHEQWFHFARQGSHFASIDPIREEYSPASLATYARSGLPQRPPAVDQVSISRKPSEYLAGGDPGKWTGNPLGKTPGSVWTVATEPLVIPEAVRAHYGLPDHFAAFPSEWPRRLVLGWSPPGGVVLDPFSGTGTTAGVARVLGRTGIGVDLSADYCRLGDWRANRSGHFAKAESRTHRENQGSLL